VKRNKKHHPHSISAQIRSWVKNDKEKRKGVVEEAKMNKKKKGKNQKGSITGEEPKS
jgi:hypothetical protein